MVIHRIWHRATTYARHPREGEERGFSAQSLRLWDTGSSAFADDDGSGCISYVAAHVAPELASRFALRDSRGRREDRVRAAPAVPCAIETKSAHTSIQVRRRHPGLPCAMALRLITCALPGERLFCLRRPRPSIVRSSVRPIRPILPDLVAHRAHRKPEQARGVGAVAVATRQRLQHELALDRLDRRADQHGNDFVG